MWQKTKNVYHLFIAILANIINRFPARKLIVIGVTGTDGKTTTTSLIYHILKTAGLRVSLISTVQAIINDERFDTGFHVTNPPPFHLQRFLKKAISAMTHKKNYLVLEVTSHGIDQNRIWGIPIHIGVLTNITNEHLDYHKTYDNYVRVKAKLLRLAKTAIYNKEDRSYEKISSLLKRVRNKKVTFGLHDGDLTLETFPFETHLPGDHNKGNCLAAIAVCKELEIADEIIRSAISSFTSPVGRGEIVYQKDFTVMIDFAHTPNSFKQILTAVRPTVSGRLIHVFGSAGERDKIKRPMMGEVSSRFADIIILTSEDPRKESIESINNEIKKGITGFEHVHITDHVNSLQFQSNVKYIIEIPNRRRAIAFALQIAQKGDFVITTGKAHELSMNYGHGEESWSEHEAVNQALKEKG